MMTKGAITLLTAILVACASLVTAAGTALAASLTITPSSIPGNYTGTVTLNITGLSNGQVVRVETFIDVNGNGVIDGSDMLVQSFQVTDGQALSIGGVRNTNVPGDEDGVADQKIRAVLNFPLLAEANKGVAKYVYRVSPVTSGFAPVTATFTITQPAYAQKVVGKVTSGGSAVPYAFTFLTDPSMNGGPTVAALADASGNFTLYAAPGSYAVLALKAGFVSDFSAPPVVTVNASATVTQNLSLTAADHTISGQLSDLDSDAGIPGVQMTAESESGLFALVFSDASGNFVIPVSSASTQWGVNPSEKPMALLGYLGLHDNYPVDISGGNVSEVSIQLPKATALIYGTLKDSQGNPLAGVGVYADQGQYEGYGLTDSGGNYVAGVTAGTWNVGPDSDELAALGYLSQGGTNVTVGAGQALRQDFTARHATAHLIGRVVDDGANPVSDVDIAAYGAGDWHSVRTDASGNFNLPVFGGKWYLILDSDSAAERGLVRSQPSFDVTDGVDITNITYVAPRATAHITGWVKDNANAPVVGVGVDAHMNVGGSTNYDSWQQTDSSGNFSLGVLNGTWWVNLSCDDVQSRGYICPNGQSVTIAGNNGTAYFTVYQPGALQITTTSLPSATQGQYFSFQLNATGGVGSYNWDLAPGSLQLPPGLNLSSNGYLSGTPTSGGTYNFTVRVNDAASHTATQGLSLSITSQPLQITTSYLTQGQVGVGYSAQLQASGGQPPYAWSMTPGSGPLPPGLALSGNTISGTPTSYGGFSFYVRVTDSASSFVDRNFSITINPAPLRMLTTSLPGGRVGVPYSTQLQATGGVPPYYWTLGPGSQSLPPGLSFGSTATPGPTLVGTSNGVISGTPTTEGTFPFIVRVTDSYWQYVDRPLSLLIKPPRQGPCEGDCGEEGQVTVDEILTLVNIALGNAQVSTCTAGDVNDDKQITIDEILRAVNAALSGCAVSPAEQGCLTSGGTVRSAMCCTSTGDFPNTCVTGACGCGLSASHEVRICDCGADSCFDGSGCVRS